MLTISSAKLTGSPDPSGWSQVHEFTPADPGKLNLRGELFAVVATSQEKAAGPVAAGRELLTRLHEEYYGHLEATAFNALRGAVETVVKEFSEDWGGVEIAAVCVLGDVVYSVAAGGAQTSIVRGGALAKILTSPERDIRLSSVEVPKEAEGRVSSASGYPQEGDFLIFGTKKFFERTPSEILKEGLKTGDVGAAAETLAPLIHARQDSGDVGVIILKFSKQEEIKEEASGKKVRISEFFLKAKGFALKLLDKLPERKIYVKVEPTDEVSGRNKRVTLSVGAIILILLIVSIAFGIRQKGLREARDKYGDRLGSAEHFFEESLSLLELNPDRSRELFSEAKNVVESLKGEGVKDKRLETLSQKITTDEGRVLGIYKGELELFLDLSLLTSGFNGDDLASPGENLFVLDKSGKRVVRVAIDTKKTETVAGPDQIESAQKAAGYENRAFVLTDSGIYEVGKKKTLVVEDSWEGEVLPYVFAANFYVLEKGAGTIWRYPAGPEPTEGFASKQNWFGAGVKPNFSSVVSITIDGAIWVLSDNGKIQKFSQGSPQAFNPQGVNPAITAAEAIYTNEENQFVYVLDKAGKRIVVLAKDGKYKAQYLSDKIGEATDLAVSEKEGKIILLSGSKLYSLELKHD